MMTERTIQQTAIETNLSVDTLRYYERIGLIVDIERAPNGHRRYSDADIIWIGFLKQLRATGMSIADMQTFAELRKQGDSTVAQRRDMLSSHRESLINQIQQLEQFIDVIDGKIARHQRTLSQLKETSS